MNSEPPTLLAGPATTEMPPPWPVSALPTESEIAPPLTVPGPVVKKSEPPFPPDPEPVLRVKAPPLFMPEPVLSLKAPPDLVDAVVAPEASVRLPPSPELPEPTDNEIAPPAPPAAVPDTM